METASAFNFAPSSSSSNDLRALQEELEQLNSDLTEANEQRVQAAEYGLVLLEQKKTLYNQHEELKGLYETTKRELDSSVNALKQVQADYEKRLKDVEAQREHLLEEMESRENSLIEKVDRGEEKTRQLERKLKQASSENERLNEYNAHLTKELDRWKNEVENYKEENRNLKQTNSIANIESEERNRDVERLEQRIERLSKFEDDCHRLQEENSALMQDSHALQEQFESVFLEKEELESQTQEAMEALREEREEKSLLETRLKEDSRVSPVSPSWAEERSEIASNLLRLGAKGGSLSPAQDDEVRSRSTTSPRATPSPHLAGRGGGHTKHHSTPYPSKTPPSLLSEMQDSFSLEADKEGEEVCDGLRRELAEMQEMVGSFKNEKRILEDNVAAYSAREAKQLKELESLRLQLSKEVSERDKKIEELNQRMLIRGDQIDQLRSKLSTATGERTSMEIEVDGLNSEIRRLQVVSGLELDKIQRESAQEQTKNIKLSSQISVLEEEVAKHVSTVQKLENIVFNSQTELVSMTEDIRSLQKVVTTLTVDANKPTQQKAGKKPQGPGVGKGVAAEDSTHNGNKEVTPVLTNGRIQEEGEEEEGEECKGGYYSLKIGQRKLSVQVHSENNTLRAIINLREQLHMIKSPLELFTKNMLERTLVHSTKHMSPPTSSSPDHAATNRINTLDLEAAVSKWRSKLMHKTEELNNLRSIMKARSTTAEVAISSLHSKLEGQARAYQTELTKLRYQIKILKKEKDENLSLRTMYAKRCEDYIDEITSVKKTRETLQQEYDNLMVSLEKTIKRKLELSTELEEYKMEHERHVLIPKQLESSRV